MSNTALAEQSGSLKSRRNPKRFQACEARRKADLAALLTSRDTRNISGFPDYLAARDGNIIACYRGRILKPSLSSGYLCVTLCNSDGKRRLLVHRLIAESFLGSPPFALAQVNHKNGVKTDNRAENLEWTSRSENQRHAADTALKPTGEKSHLAKLTATQVSEIRGMLGTMSQKKIGDIFGVSQACIQKIASGKKWRND